MRNHLLLILLTSSIMAGSCGKINKAAEPVDIQNAAVLEVPPVQKTTAAFMSIKNNTSDDDYLISAETEVAEVCEMHKMVMEGEVMRMEKLDSVELPAGQTVVLKRGGMHLMLINLKREVKAGESITVKLKFKNANDLTVKAEVKSMDDLN